jgi:hypothetical protein
MQILYLQQLRICTESTTNAIDYSILVNFHSLDFLRVKGCLLDRNCPTVKSSYVPNMVAILFVVLLIVGDYTETELVPDPKGPPMQKAKSAKSKEWGPEVLVEWMLKSKDVSKGNIKLLLESRSQIRQAWDWDHQGTKGFPMNTAQLLYEIETRLKGWRPRKRRTSLKGIHLKPPAQLRDILPERTVHQVHEYLYEEPFKEALVDLYSEDARSQALERIRNTILNSLTVQQFGFEALPRPRGNWLHRQVLGALTAVAPGKFSDLEMVKLFDYFCPCGTTHNREAMKKFRWRLTSAHR